MTRKRNMCLVVILTLLFSSTLYASSWTSTKIVENATINIITKLAQSGNKVAWYGNDGEDDEVYCYNGTTMIQLTNNSTNDSTPAITGDYVAWWGYDSGTDTEVFMYDGSTVSQLTNNSLGENAVKASNGYIGWQELDSGVYSVKIYDGTTTVTVNNALLQSMSGNTFVWRQEYWTPQEMFMFPPVTIIELINIILQEIL